MIWFREITADAVISTYSTTPTRQTKKQHHHFLIVLVRKGDNNNTMKESIVDRVVCMEQPYPHLRQPQQHYPSNRSQRAAPFETVISLTRTMNLSKESLLQSRKTEVLTTIPKKKDKNKQKSVRFDTLHIQEYRVSLAASSIPGGGGAPVGIDWVVLSRYSMSVDKYEAHRAPRRSRQDLLLYRDERYRR
jgi:hypothetical protein